MKAELKEQIEKLIPGCFGTADLEFADHPFDAEQARELLVIILKNNVPLSIYQKLVRDYLIKKGAKNEHINLQLSKMLDLEVYLDD